MHIDTPSSSPQNKQALRIAMRLSLWIGFAMVMMKVGAYSITGSAAILSDAAESVVHVAAVLFAWYSLRLALRPADASHQYGHAKVSFFSSGFEGAMILLAAVYIVYVAVSKWMSGLELQNLGLGTGLTAVAAAINGGLGWYLLRTGKRRHSIILEANGRHVLTDCWTSIGVLVGLGLTLLTGWLPWDPIFAILVACNIMYSGVDLVRQSIGGLMDVSDPDLHRKLEAVLEEAALQYEVEYHNLRHRNAGNAYWVEAHLIFPGDTPLRVAHEAATRVEARLREAFDVDSYITTHLESREDHTEVHRTDRHGTSS